MGNQIKKKEEKKCVLINLIILKSEEIGTRVRMKKLT